MVEYVNKAIHYTGRVLLGLFICWQVFFLFTSGFVKVEKPLRTNGLSNLQDMDQTFPIFMRGKDDFHTALEEFHEKRLRRYAQATAQPQSWGLFAPNVGEVFSFAELEVRWDADHLDAALVKTSDVEPLFLPSVNEPEDINAFLRYRNFRLRKYETNFTPLPVRVDGVFDPKSTEWRERIEKDVKEDGDNMVAFLRWRWQEYQRQTDLPEPTQVILYMRAYEIPPPPGPNPWSYRDLGRHPVARWLPWKKDQDKLQALERYDPLNDRYESVQ